MAQDRFYATGKRKNAIARVWLTPGTGKVIVNNMEADAYFGQIFKSQQHQTRSLTGGTYQLYRS